jgi:hypothetical protein
MIITTYGGEAAALLEFCGYTGHVVKQTDEGAWIEVKDTFLAGERVDTAWAYEYTETILPAFFGHAYHAPVACLFVTNDELNDPGAATEVI